VSDILAVLLTYDVCMQDYCKTDQPFLLKHNVMIGLTNHKNWLTFGGVPVPDMDSGSLFHFTHHCGMADFRRFISVSHRVTGRFHDLSEMTDSSQVMNPQHVGSDPADIRTRIRISL